ncbi:DUF3883 domain-containing protein [Candidatus Kaistella beijingensis]|uniref:DUF3883 domain-containing protein n=1 Tax=Candidatus Kaistella beijingensis TaxID=2820270 RepID=UPI001CC53797|nr:DUF3883 domain-containing protein [Candidatus Kaistella beijingensis]UBB90046.1 DUF3883 domain-containing protein [Candidatus Kaistella beijingensis]
MNIQELRETQAKFQILIDNLIENKKSLYKLRDDFAKYYNETRILNMPLDTYVLGKSHTDVKFHFCYTTERSLDRLGRIIGSKADKFGVYYGKTKSENEYKYRFTKKWGNSKEEVFINIKHSIVELIEAGKKRDLKTLAKNKISPMFKGKILNVYYPEEYLNVFSDEHLDYFLVLFNLDNPKLIMSNSVYKREALKDFKNSDEIMKDWPMDIFADFLYKYFHPKLNKEKDFKINKKLDDDYGDQQFPSEYLAEWEDLEMMQGEPIKKVKSKEVPKDNPDYEKEARKLKKLGDRGEKIVIEMEQKRLTELGFPALAEKVEKAKYDYLGYDILSYETNGDERYIEVKATRAKVGTANFFLSSNELETAEELPNYYIYMVYDITSKNPKIWIIDNPFNPENDKVVKTPVSYRVIIEAKKREY